MSGTHQQNHGKVNESSSKIMAKKGGGVHNQIKNKVSIGAIRNITNADSSVQHKAHSASLL